MKYFTRELYESIQPGSGVPEEEADRQWQERSQAYQRHLDAIRARLPAGMQLLAENSLHDGVVLGVKQLPDGRLRLETDATQNPWGPRGVFTLTFSGVREVEGLETIVGDWWLYEEAHLHPRAAFDFRVLFSQSQFRVVAEEVELAG